LGQLQDVLVLGLGVAGGDGVLAFSPENNMVRSTFCGVTLRPVQPT
jgi:hypothetical protein